MSHTDIHQYVVSPQLRAEPVLSRLVDEARPILEDALGESAHLVKAEWRRDEDAGWPYAILNLSDFTLRKGVETHLTPEDFADRRYLRRRFHDLWGDLLQARLKGIVKKLDAFELNEATP